MVTHSDGKHRLESQAITGYLIIINDAQLEEFTVRRQKIHHAILFHISSKHQISQTESPLQPTRTPFHPSTGSKAKDISTRTEEKDHK
jgi:hypothetical protein